MAILQNHYHISLFYLNRIAPKNCKGYLQKVLQKKDKQAAPPTVPEIVTLLTSRYKLAYAWQQQVYSISSQEEAELIRRCFLGWILPYQVLQIPPTDYLYQDEDLILFPGNDNRVLLDRLRDEVVGNSTLKDLYLFLLENQALPGFLVVSKVIITVSDVITH